MCNLKLCGTRTRKTLEILTDVDSAYWPPPDAECTPSCPCDTIRKGKHPERLEWAATTASAEYEQKFCTLLATAIFKHHNIPIMAFRAWYCNLQQ